MIAFLRIAMVLLLGVSGAIAQTATPQDPGAMTQSEIETLQRRLVDAKCNAGAIDGRPSDDLTKAIAACPDQRPQLGIETGMHVALIKHLGVDAACHVAATGSLDKTIRVWSLPDGRLLRTLRPPIEAGDGGVFAVAMTPDGRWVAAGGRDASLKKGRDNAVYIFDASSGAMKARIGGFDSIIDHLAFSPDGSWLVATSNAKSGVRMIDAVTWRVVAEDKDYAGDSYGADFGRDGRLYTVSHDGMIRRYGPGPTFAKERQIQARGGATPYHVSVDPRGELLAVAFYDSTRIDFYDLASLAFRKAVDFPVRGSGNLAHLVWTRDGERLVAGGNYADGVTIALHGFDRDGRRSGAPIPIGPNTIAMDVKTCGDAIAVASGTNAFGVFDRNGAQVLWRHGVSIDMREKIGRDFMISPDASVVQIGVDGHRSLRFDLKEATLSEASGTREGLEQPRVSGLPISGWHNGRRPTLAGKPIPIESVREMARAIAIRPDRGGFALGTDHTLRTFDGEGRLLWTLPVTDPVWGANISADGRILVTANGDGTIRWRRLSDGQDLLALYINATTNGWVAWTPSGYYSASPGAEDMIGWHVNRGWDQTADFFPASRFRDIYARSDIVGRVLDTLDEAQAIKAADASRSSRTSTGTAVDRLPPIVSILAPADGARVEGESVRIAYSVRSPSGLPLGGIEVLVDGRRPSVSRGLARLTDPVFEALKQCLADTHGMGRNEDGGCRGSVTVSLPPGTSEIGVFARAGDRASVVEKRRVTRGAAATADEAEKPKLYALVIGISAYANAKYALGFAAKDADDFSAALKNQTDGLYGAPDIRVLTDGKASAAAIRDGFEWLSKKVTKRDVGLVYLAGHGMIDDLDRFYFLAADSDVDRLKATAIPRGDIADALEGLPGKALLFIDACHSGAVAAPGASCGSLDINGVVNDLTSSERGVVTFTASTGRQVSQENAAWNNGAFTKAVVEGLGLPGQKGKADFLGDGRITASELDAYVTKRVAALTGGAQSPIMIRPPTVPDFALALSR